MDCVLIFRERVENVLLMLESEICRGSPDPNYCAGFYAALDELDLISESDKEYFSKEFKNMEEKYYG